VEKLFYFGLVTSIKLGHRERTVWLLEINVQLLTNDRINRQDKRSFEYPIINGFILYWLKMAFDQSNVCGEWEHWANT